MSFQIKDLKDPKIISFFLDNLKDEPFYFKEYTDFKHYNEYFDHTHKTVDILRAPKNGETKNISRDGRIVNYKFGNAVN